MKFTPMNFQISVAAGGVALMPFVLMQFALPHGEGMITLNSLLILNFAYVIAVGWGVFCICLLTGYLRNFMRESYSPAQWGMI